MEIFGIGLPEILLIMTVALIVFGPEKLPEIAREAGKMVRQFRQLTSEATTEIRNLTNEVGIADEIKNINQELKGVTTSLREEMTKVTNEVSGVKTEVTETVSEQYMVKYEPAPETAPVEPTATVTSTIREVTDAEREEFNRRRLEELAFSSPTPEAESNASLIESAVENNPATALDPKAAEEAAVEAAYAGGWFSPTTSPYEVNSDLIENSTVEVADAGTSAADAGELPVKTTKPRIGRRSAFSGRNRE